MSDLAKLLSFGLRIPKGILNHDNAAKELIIRWNGPIPLGPLCPAESVVESMASTVKDMYGVHRQLNHENAAKELIVRWNGPDPSHADFLTQTALKKGGFNFTRSAVSIVSALQGTVIARHKATKCARAHIFQGPRPV